MGKLYGLRETFLAAIGQEHAATIRAFGNLFNDLSYEIVGELPGTLADATAHALRAVVADLRFLQGYLASYEFQIEELQEEAHVTPRHRRWVKFGFRMSRRLAKLADEIEKELAAAIAVPDR